MGAAPSAVEAVGLDPAFWRGRRVLLTGHTGFKGAWLAFWLERLGAEVTAFALPPATDPSLFAVLAPWPKLTSILGDLRDAGLIAAAVRDAAPEIVLHLAAQALVRPSYRDPLGTFASNVAGTAHLLEAVRAAASVRAVLVVTSDKVYANDETGRAFREDDALGGKDPYSASKACQEIVTASYRHSFLAPAGVRVATARAGNVIGGGDWAEDRLVPDFVRAAGRGETLVLRHPEAVRPWQHVLEPLAGYLTYAQRLCEGAEVPPALNFGPRADDARTVGAIVRRLTEAWGGGGPGWQQDAQAGVPEAHLLTLDAGAAQRAIGWRPVWTADQALDRTAAWYRAHLDGQDMRAVSARQLDEYEEMSR